MRKARSRHVIERREVRGVNCNCGPGEGGGRYEGQRVSYRY